MRWPAINARAAVLPLVLIVAILLALLSFVTPNSHTNLFLSDELFLANGAYLLSRGLVPHVDFAWQFGGYEIALVAIAMRLFGASFKAIEQGIALHYLIIVSLLAVGTYRRANRVIFIALFLLVSAVALTRFPFENGPSANLQIQTYSMFYNRIGWSLVMVLYSPLLLGEGALGKSELAACAIAMFLIIVTKLSFAAFLPLAIALLWWRNGWPGVLRAAGIVALLALAGWILLGFGPEAYLRMPADNYQVYRDWFAQNRKFGALYKLAYMVLIQFVPLCAVAAAAVYAHKRIRGSGWLLASVMALVGLSVVVCLSTGTFYALDTVSPILPFGAIILAAYWLAVEPAISAMMIFYVLVFALPYGLNYLAGVAKEATRGGDSIFAQGHLKGLIVEQLDYDATPKFSDGRAAIQYLKARSDLNHGTAWMTPFEEQYLVEDARQLISRSGAGDLRVGSFTHGLSSFALGSRILPSYTFMYGVTAPSVPSALPADVDAVIVSKYGADALPASHYRADLEGHFTPRAESPFWILYVRR